MSFYADSVVYIFYAKTLTKRGHQKYIRISLLKHITLPHGGRFLTTGWYIQEPNILCPYRAHTYWTPSFTCIGIGSLSVGTALTEFWNTEQWSQIFFHHILRWCYSV